MLDSETFASLGRIELPPLTSSAVSSMRGFVGRRGPLLYAARALANAKTIEVEVLSYGNQAPSAAVAPVDGPECGRPILLDGSGSSDPDDLPGRLTDIVEWVWTHVSDGAASVLGTGPVISVELARGPQSIALEAKDHAGATSRAQLEIVVGDTTPPALTLRADPASIPDRERYVGVDIDVTAHDACGGAIEIRLESVEHNEVERAPNGIGSGARDDPGRAAVQDAELGADDRHVELLGRDLPRAPQRIYTLRYSARDADGNVSMASVEVPVRPATPWERFVDFLRRLLALLFGPPEPPAHRAESADPIPSAPESAGGTRGARRDGGAPGPTATAPQRGAT